MDDSKMTITFSAEDVKSALLAFLGSRLKGEWDLKVTQRHKHGAITVDLWQTPEGPVKVKNRFDEATG